MISPRHAFVALAATGFFTLTALGAAASSQPKSPPVLVGLPTISGSPNVGKTLSVSEGSWYSEPSGGKVSYAYRWYRCTTSCVAVQGATSDTYALTTADVGSQIRGGVTATNRVGTGTAVSEPTPPVISPSSAPVPPSNNVGPAVSGVAMVGQTLTASTGSWWGDPTISYTYQWYYCDSGGSPCSPITGYTRATYSPVNDDVGGRNKVRVTATNSAGSSSMFSDLTEIVTVPSSTAMPPFNSAPPTIIGDLQVGKSLTAAPGTWSGSTPMVYAYQWNRCLSSCSAIIGATTVDYSVSTADINAALRVVVTASNAVGSSVAQSAATSTVTSTVASSPTAPFFSTGFEDGTLSAFDNLDLGGGTIAVRTMPQGGTSPGLVRTTTSTAASGSRSVELTATPTSRASPASGWDSVYLWNQIKGYIGHNGQETWQRFHISFPDPGFATPQNCWEGCPWFMIMHNDDGYLPLYNSGLVTWEYSTIVFGVSDGYRLADGTVKPQIFMRAWGGESNTPAEPNKSNPVRVYTRAAIKYNHWYDFKLHIKWAPDATNGLVEWWLDGELLYSGKTPTLWKRPDGSVSVANFDLTNYRPHLERNSTIYFDDVMVGPTAGSIGG